MAARRATRALPFMAAVPFMAEVDCCKGDSHQRRCNDVAVLTTRVSTDAPFERAIFYGGLKARACWAAAVIANSL